MGQILGSPVDGGLAWRMPEQTAILGGVGVPIRFSLANLWFLLLNLTGGLSATKPSLLHVFRPRLNISDALGLCYPTAAAR